MTDLTEQYKHGNLPDDRLYYYRFKGEPEVQITTQYGLYCEEADNKKEIEVIDFVPSYEEYERILVENDSLKQIRDELDCAITQLREDKIDLEEENAQLKELLKECKQWFDWYHIDTGTGKEYIESWHKKGNEIHKKINEVLK